MDKKYTLTEDILAFPKGTLGYKVKFNPEIPIPLLDYALETSNFFEDSEFTESLEEPDTDEVLRDLGFYDSSDPRSCINKKRK